jgi:hypothetical protein
MSVHSFFVAAISISSIVAHRRKLQFHSRNALLQSSQSIRRPRRRRRAVDEHAVRLSMRRISARVLVMAR